MPNGLPWTEEDKKIVRAMWESGKSSATEIAGIFKTTRGAIAGLCDRNKWETPNKRCGGRKLGEPQAKRIVPVNIKRRIERVSSPQPLPPLEPDPEPSVFDLAIPVEQRKTILELTDKVCHFPVGTPGEGNFFYCGAESLNGFSYCFHHYRRSIDPEKRLRKRKPPHSFTLQKISVRL